VSMEFKSIPHFPIELLFWLYRVMELFNVPNRQFVSTFSAFLPSCEIRLFERYAYGDFEC
jgi:hypothetical protein